MKSSRCYLFAAFFFLPGLCVSARISSGAELARVNGEPVTSEEFVMDYRVASTGGGGGAPDTTMAGKKEFLERVIAKHLLSGYFHSRGWDTLSVWDSLLVEYYRGQYIQALYYEAIPEARALGLVDVKTLMDLSKAYVDSLQKAYHLNVDQKAVIFMGDRSVVRRMDSGAGRSQPLIWKDLFSDDEEKAMPVATMEGGVLTLGEFVALVDALPDFARPTGGNTDQIALTVEHFGREKIFELEFNKLGLRDKPFFLEKARKKREELILNQLFTSMQDTVTVTRERLAEYYESHRDDFMTVPMVSLAIMRFKSEDVARQAAKKLAEGKDFESVAVDFSVYSASEAGFDTTGFISRDKNQAMFDATWDNPIGSTTGPVFADEAWCIAKLLARLDPRLLTLEEAIPFIQERVRFAEADAALAALIKELRSKAQVVVHDDVLQAITLPHFE